MATPQSSSSRQPGYRLLRAYQFLYIIFDLTDQFCKIHIAGPEHRRTREQMFQAGRSSKQCLLEGYTQEGLSGYIKLTGISHGSNEELREDYLDFLRQRGLPIWDKSDPRISRVGWVSRACREISEGKNPTYPSLPTDPTHAANFLLDLTTKTGFLLQRLVDSLIEKHRTQGGLTEKLYRARKDYRGF